MAQRLPRLVAALVVVLLAIAVLSFLRGNDTTRITAYFTSGTGLYEGDDVKIVGVKVGKVTKIVPAGSRVKVEIAVDDDQPIPADARAAIVSPSLVNGRFVQLEPAYVEGPKMRSGAVIEVDRTAVPISFDEVKEQLTDLATALGPDQSDARDGALRDVIDTVDANLGAGNADRLRSTLTAMRKATTQLSGDRGDLFDTVDNLNSFTANLVVNDQALRAATGELKQFSETLDDNKLQLSTTIETLAIALNKVETFVDDNGSQVNRSLAKLDTLTTTVAGQADNLAQLLHTAPGAVEGLYNTVDRSAITGRPALTNLDSLASLVCGLLLGAGGGAEDCRTGVSPLLEVLGIDDIGTSLKPSAGQTPYPPAGKGGTGNEGSTVGGNLIKDVQSLLEDVLGGASR